MSMQRVVAQITVGDMETVVIVDNVAYSPDIAHDVMNRAKEGIAEAVRLGGTVVDGDYSEIAVDEEAMDVLNEILAQMNEDYDGDTE